ncbi:MAG: NosD domain-containing protein [Promethearchaeota archaeon]
MNCSTKVLIMIIFLLILPRLDKEALEIKTTKLEVLGECDTFPSKIDSTISIIEQTSTLPVVYVNYSDLGEDLDNSSLLDRVVLFVEINMTQYVPTPFTITLLIQPLVQGITPFSIEPIEISRKELLSIGINNLSIPVATAESFLSFGYNVSFHIKEINIINFTQFSAPIFTDTDSYTTRVYLREEFDHFLLILGIIGERVVDSDFDSYFDHLIIEIRIDILKRGMYHIEMEVVPDTDSFTGVLKSVNQSFLEEGINEISVSLDAALLRNSQIGETSLIVTQIIVTKNYVVLDRIYLNYETQVYSYADFDLHSIIIDGNKEFDLIVKDFNLKGAGSSIDPYIISGFIFTDKISLNLINIKNVDYYFQITDNILSGGVIGICLNNLSNCQILHNNLQNNQVGIYLKGVDECFISQNTISRHNEGLLLEDAKGIFISHNSFYSNINSIKLTNQSDNNVIANNSISASKTTDEIGVGILVDNSQHNLVMENDFHDNDVNMFDSGLDNNLSSNFWSDWTGEGYYWVPGEFEERYLFLRNHDSAPSDFPNHIAKIILLSPLSGETFTEPTLEITWMTNDNLGHELMYDVYYSVDNGTNWTLLSTKGEVSYFKWNIRSISQGNYRIKIEAYDSLGFIRSEISDRFTIQKPINLSPFVGAFYGTILLMIALIGLVFKLK